MKRVMSWGLERLSGAGAVVALLSVSGCVGSPGPIAAGGVTAAGSGGGAASAGSSGSGPTSVGSGGHGGGVTSAGSGGAPASTSATSGSTVSSSVAASSGGPGGSTSSGSCVTSVVPLSDGNPGMTVLVDLDGDGAFDLVVPENGPCGTQVFLGDGHGAFGAGSLVQVGPGGGACASVGVAVADFDGDDVPDLAALDILGQQVSVLLGKGDGSFKPYKQFPAPQGGAFGWGTVLAVADFNGDGKPDVVTAGLTLLLGNGDGTLQAGQPIGAGLSCGGLGCFLAVGDLDGDGIADLAISTPGDGDITALRGVGNGTFKAPLGSGANVYASSIALGDFDGDGHLDLALAEIEAVDVEVMLGHGDGTFGAPSLVFAGPGPISGGSTASVAVHDVDGDGRLDLVFTFGTILYVYLGDGHGHFAPSPLTKASPLTPSTVGWVEQVSVARAGATAGSPLLYTAADGDGEAVTVYAGACY